MNFLSHYAILQENQNPHFTLGKVLPDLLRGAAPKKHLRQVVIDPGWEPGVRELAKGVNVHLQTDLIFHESEYFKLRMEDLKARLRDLEFQSIQRFYFFYAHILVELLLDRWLMQDNHLLVNRFYSQLKEVDEVTISQFLRYKDLREITNTVLTFINRFTGAGYLISYLELEGIVYALDRISQRAGLPVFSKSDAQLLINSLSAWEEALRPGYFTIFSHIEKEING